MTVNERVRKHREKLYEEQRHRLEVSVELPLLESVQEIATSTNRLRHEVIQEALRAHVEDYRKLSEDDSKLDNDRARLELLPINAPGFSMQQAEYNRQVQDYNRRRSRFFKDT